MPPRSATLVTCAIALVWCGLLPGCIPALPVPDAGDHAGETPVPVPYAPPAARADVILDPPAGMADPRWIDGQWLWRGSRWVWEPGRWVAADPARVYAKPAVVRRVDGQLVWFEGKLRPRAGAKETVSP